MSAAAADVGPGTLSLYGDLPMIPDDKKSSQDKAADVRGDQTISDDDASKIAGGFNPQPDPPAKFNPVSNPVFNPVITPNARP